MAAPKTAPKTAKATAAKAGAKLPADHLAKAEVADSNIEVTYGGFDLVVDKAALTDLRLMQRLQTDGTAITDVFDLVHAQGSGEPVLDLIYETREYFPLEEAGKWIAGLYEAVGAGN